MIIAVDTGGTKTLVARFSSRGLLETSKRFPTPQDTDTYIRELVEIIRLLAEDEHPTVVSIAMPNITDSSYVPVFSNLPWRDFDVIASLKPFFPASQLIIGNDAKIGGLGEARSLASVPARVLYVTISTGIGTGMVIDGSLSKELAYLEAGHAMLEYDGTLRDWETFASGKAIYMTYKQYAKDITSEQTWRDIVDRISRGFFSMIPALQPDLIIIGGSMGTHFAKFGPQLTALLDEKLPATIKRPEIIQAMHPEEAVIYGCYYHAIDQ